MWRQKFFLYLWQDKPLWVELKIYGGVIFITILLHFHYFISLETANTQKSEVFLMRISYKLIPTDILKFQFSSFKEEFSKTLFKWIYVGF